MTVYAMCKPPRAGLGNKLIPWARSVIYAQRHGLQRISTPFVQWAVGPTLRREKDSRVYAGQFRNDPKATSTLHGWALRAALPLLAEPTDLTLAPKNGASGIVEFTSLAGNFSTLCGENDSLRKALLRITKSKWQPHDPVPAIGLHVRRGDFANPEHLDGKILGGCVQTPLIWYRDILRGIRKRLGRDIEAFVVSDGRDDELAALLSEPNVARIDRGCAIADMWALSHARVILGSGGSTFTGWATFLGSAPMAIVPGQSLEWLGFSEHTDAWRGNVDSARDTELDAFSDVVERALSAESQSKFHVS